MAASNTKIRNLIRRTTCDIAPGSADGWKDVDPGRSVADYTTDRQKQKIVQMYVQLSLQCHGIPPAPWPARWENLRIADLARRLNEA